MFHIVRVKRKRNGRGMRRSCGVPLNKEITMNRPNNPAYTRAELQRWKTDMLLKRPATRHKGGKVQGVVIASLDVKPSGNGMHVLINTSRDDEIMMLLNPVVAQALRDGITQFGIEEGWLQADGTLTIPET
jgi:hypothetical protein